MYYAVKHTRRPSIAWEGEAKRVAQQLGMIIWRVATDEFGTRRFLLRRTKERVSPLAQIARVADQSVEAKISGKVHNAWPTAELHGMWISERALPKARRLPRWDDEVFAPREAWTGTIWIPDPLSVEPAVSEEIVVIERTPWPRHLGIIAIMGEEDCRSSLARAKARTLIMQHHKHMISTTARVPMWSRGSYISGAVAWRDLLRWCDMPLDEARL
eukprot:scaffold127345_cov30-Tisochrysis_lutea.AAC.1